MKRGIYTKNETVSINSIFVSLISYIHKNLHRESPLFQYPPSKPITSPSTILLASINLSSIILLILSLIHI